MSIPDYFGLLGLERSFDIDMQALESAYFAAQRQYHPDRFVKKSPAERQQALQISVDANNGYNMLKEPYSRAVYMLKQQAIDVTDSQGAQKPSQALLMEIMAWREEAEEAHTAGALSAIENTLSGLQSEAIRHISQAISSGQWPLAGEQTMRLGYIQKTRTDIAQRIKRLTQAS